VVHSWKDMLCRNMAGKESLKPLKKFDKRAQTPDLEAPHEAI
jgi:hypothetical protein